MSDKGDKRVVLVVFFILTNLLTALSSRELTHEAVDRWWQGAIKADHDARCGSVPIGSQPYTLNCAENDNSCGFKAENWVVIKQGETMVCNEHGCKKLEGGGGCLGPDGYGHPCAKTTGKGSPIIEGVTGDVNITVKP